MTDKLDVSEGLLLLERWNECSPMNVGRAGDALSSWLLDNAEALIRAAEERDALLRCVEAADKLAASALDSHHESLRFLYKQARAALDALRSGKLVK